MLPVFRYNGFNLVYCPSLDGLRAIAILGVMLAHAQVPYCEAGGGTGVGVFFVLSGFLITSVLAQEWRKDGVINLKRFYIRRMLRLFPALFLLLLVYLSCSFLTLPILRWKWKLVDASIVFFYGSNWANAFQIIGLGSLSHTWSLSVEEQFYLIWPCLMILLLKYCRSRYAVIVITGFAALSSYWLRTIMFENGASIQRMYNGLDTRADSLLIGCTLALVLYSGLLSTDNKRILMITRNLSMWAAVGLFGIVSGLGAKYHSLWSHVYFLMSIFSALLIAGLMIAPSPTMRKVLGSHFLVRIGKISYGLYLWHYPIFSTMLEHNLPWQVVVMIGAPLTYLVAEVSYRFIEQPFLLLKDRWGSVGRNVNTPEMQVFSDQPLNTVSNVEQNS
jgi:peptidoglycan/LPS O-acetylase OafA/YrhL